MSLRLIFLLIIFLTLCQTSLNQSSPLKSSFNINSAESVFRDLVKIRNMMLIEQHNSKENSFRLGPNQFLSLTTEQFRAKMGTTSPASASSTSLPFVGSTVSLTSNINIDWQALGKVSPIKDQGQCNSCYAFGAIADIESAYLIKSNKLYDLSQQQIVECSSSFGNSFCSGGFYQHSLQYIVRNGVSLQQDYPYTATVAKCKNATNNKIRIFSFTAFRGTSCSVLENTVRSRPALVSLDGVNEYWQFYRSGILNFCGNNNILSHAAQVIGIRTFPNGTSYYIVKNSWGTWWGENGKIRIDRRAQHGNLCRICSFIYYSNV